MKIGYAKFGRSMTFNPDKYGFQGDAEAPNLLRRLAERNPGVEWVAVGRNTGGTLGRPNITNPWNEGYTGLSFANYKEDWKRRPPEGAKVHYFKGTDGGLWEIPDGLERDRRLIEMIGHELDGLVLHLGQHGASSVPLPPSEMSWRKAKENPRELTGPQMWVRNYCQYLVEGLNVAGERTNGRFKLVMLCADPRNYLKDRSIKWPMGHDKILAQYKMRREQRHDRFEDPRRPQELGYDARTDRLGEIWIIEHRYEHSDLELMILPDNWETWGVPGWDERKPAGIATTSFNVGRPRRSELVAKWLLPAFPEAEIWGKWDDISLKDVPADKVQLNDPKDFQKLLESWRVTLALPVLGGGWTAAKPYQCFAARVACFMLGELDDQGWVLPTRRRGPGTREVGEKLYSVRPSEEWTPEELQLARFLRVEWPTEFAERSKQLVEDQDKWGWVVATQLQLLLRRWEERRLERDIERQLSL